MNIPETLFKSAFPLRVVAESAGEGFEVWTRDDRTIKGAFNNFVVVSCIQHQAEAEWICAALNAYALDNSTRPA
jgi:hypothetical protein